MNLHIFFSLPMNWKEGERTSHSELHPNFLGILRYLSLTPRVTCLLALGLQVMANYVNSL